MPTCARYSYIGLQGTQSPSNWLWNSAGTAAVVPYVLARSLVTDVTVTDVAKCEVVSLSGPEYQALVGRIEVLEQRPVSGGSEGNAVNVSAEIFIGALLVVCFIGGWIAGAQR